MEEVYTRLRAHADAPMKSYDGVNTACLVTRVIDGDTVVVVIEDTGRFEKHHLRIYGIDAPEIHTKNADEKKSGLHSKDLLSKAVEMCNGCGRVELMKDDKYGRRLGKLFLVDNGEEADVSKFMLDGGLAYAYFGKTKKKFA